MRRNSNDRSACIYPTHPPAHSLASRTKPADLTCLRLFAAHLHPSSCYQRHRFSAPSFNECMHGWKSEAVTMHLRLHLSRILPRVTPSATGSTIIPSPVRQSLMRLASTALPITSPTTPVAAVSFAILHSQATEWTLTNASPSPRKTSCRAPLHLRWRNQATLPKGSSFAICSLHCSYPHQRRILRPSSPSFNSHLRQRVSVKATPETDISEDRRSDEIIPRIQGQSDKLSDCGEATCQYSESLPSSSFSAESSIPSAPSTLLAPFFMIFSSSRRSPYLPVLASGPPSSRAVKSTFPRLKKILLTTLLLFLLLQGLLFFPYLIGEDRANQWGWQHPSDWLGFKNSLWRFMPPPVSHLPLHVQHPPDSSSLPLHHLSLDLLNSLSTEAPYMLASDPRRVTAEAFPPPWGAFVQYDAAKSYP